KEALDDRRAAHAVATYQANHLTLRNVKTHVKQRLRGAIFGGEILYGKHAYSWYQASSSSPRYALRTSGCLRISSTVPVAMILPYTSTLIRSANENTAFMSCSIRTMVYCPFSVCSSSIAAAPSAALIPAIGSSSNSRRGPAARAIAISSCRRCPYARLA